jgi:hypothetical protein
MKIKVWTLVVAFFLLFGYIVARGQQAPGGIVELSTAPSTRVPPVNGTFVPTTRGRFVFPAPYNTEAWRLTIPSDCPGGTDCVLPVGYSFWERINNHAGRPELYVVMTLSRERGGPGPVVIKLEKTTGTTTLVGPLFAATDPRSWYHGEGYYFSGTNPTMVYVPNGTNQVQRVDILSKQTTVAFDLNNAVSTFGANRYAWQVHSSVDDRVHSFIVRNSVDYSWLGCGVYLESTQTWRYFPKVRDDFDECQIDKSGRWLLIKEDVDGAEQHDNRIIDLQTGTETRLLDPNGAGGHSDNGYGVMVAEDNFAGALPQLRLWTFGSSPVGPGTVAFQESAWTATHVSINNEVACTSSISPGREARQNEISCFKLDGSKQTVVVAPILSSLGGAGGGDEYYKQPKASLDPVGEYAIWTGNLGGDKMHAFMVRIPRHALGLNYTGVNIPLPPVVDPPPPSTSVTLEQVLQAIQSGNAEVLKALTGVQCTVQSTGSAFTGGLRNYTVRCPDGALSNGLKVVIRK